VRWQITSTEKEKARAKATASQGDWRMAAWMVITRQNRLTITVKAFFSDRYFFMAVAFVKGEFYRLANVSTVPFFSMRSSASRLFSSAKFC
jgi:hypothetical protein